MTKLVNLTKINIGIDYIPVDVCQRIKQKLATINSKVTDFNLWDFTHDDTDFQLLKDTFLSAATMLVREDSNTVDNLELARAWAVGYKDWEYQAPHHHGGTFVIGVAYIDVSEDSGDLLIQDPLASYNWINRDDKRLVGNRRASMPITPTTGMIVVMPGYLIHSTEPKPVGKTRLVIATNFDS